MGVLVAGAVCLVSQLAAAQNVELSRARIAELIQEAPETRAVAARVSVSRAVVSAAGVVSLENPLLSGMGGIRVNPDGTRPFAGTATLSWPIDTGGKRGARREAAAAEEREAGASGEAERRRLLLALLIQHAAVLKDEEALKIAEGRKAHAERVLESARKRRTAGSVPELDVSLATLQEARETAAAFSAQGERDADLLRLATMLGLPREQAQKVSGALVPGSEPQPLEVMLQKVEQRADVHAAAAKVEAARARASRERSAGAPTLNLLAQYERDDGANIGMLGLAVPLPVLNANNLEKVRSAAEVDAAEAELDFIKATSRGQIRELYVKYESTKRVRAALGPTLGAVKQAVHLATRAYDLGEGDLASVLLVQREALEAERAVLEVEHAHAVAKLELLVAAGRTPE